MAYHPLNARLGSEKDQFLTQLGLELEGLKSHDLLQREADAQLIRPSGLVISLEGK